MLAEDASESAGYMRSRRKM